MRGRLSAMICAKTKADRVNVLPSFFPRYIQGVICVRHGHTTDVHRHSKPWQIPFSRSGFRDVSVIFRSSFTVGSIVLNFSLCTHVAKDLFTNPTAQTT